MTTAWNYITGEYRSNVRMNKLSGTDQKVPPNYEAPDGWVINPIFPVRRQDCMLGAYPPRAMTAEELAARDAAKEAAHQEGKAREVKARENAYRGLCNRYGFPESVQAEDGLRDALIAARDAALVELNNPKMLAVLQPICDAIDLDNLAGKITVADIPTGGHVIPE